MDTALLVIDPQNDFCEGGSLAVPHANEIFPALNKLLSLRYALVAVSLDTHPHNHVSFASCHRDARPFSTIAALDASSFGVEERVQQTLWPDHCVAGTEGQRLHASLSLPHNTLYVEKGTHTGVDSYSAFGDAMGGKYEDTGLRERLRERAVRRVVVAGLATDYCVFFTCLDALRLGLEVVLVLEACRGVAEETTSAAVRTLREKGAVVCETVSEFVARFGSDDAL